MNVFTEDEARYYCSKYSITNSSSAGSIKDFCSLQLRKDTVIREGTVKFDLFRNCSLRNAERLLFLAVSNYRQSYNLLISSSASWAYVTLYYSAFLSASALLGLFGVYLDVLSVVIDVGVGNKHSQELNIHHINYNNKNLRKFTTFTSSHKAFWDLYYKATRNLSSFITDPTLKLAISPINSIVSWQIDQRNDLNYDSFKAISLATDFKNSFDHANIPGSMPGVLQTQFKVTEALIYLTISYAREFNLNTDALLGLSAVGSRGDRIRSLIVEPLSECSLDSSVVPILCS